MAAFAQNSASSSFVRARLRSLLGEMHRTMCSASCIFIRRFVLWAASSTLNFRTGYISFPPWAGITRSSLCIYRLQDAVISVVDGLVCPVTHADNILRVKQGIRVLQHVLFRQRVQVVDNNAWSYGLAVPYHPVHDLVVRARQVASAIPHDDPVPERPPLSRLVEVLVQVPVKAKGVIPNFAVELQIMEPVFKCLQSDQFGVSFNTHPVLPRPVRCTPAWP